MLVTSSLTPSRLKRRCRYFPVFCTRILFCCGLVLKTCYFVLMSLAKAYNLNRQLSSKDAHINPCRPALASNPPRRWGFEIIRESGYHNKGQLNGAGVRTGSKSSGFHKTAQLSTGSQLLAGLAWLHPRFTIIHPLTGPQFRDGLHRGPAAALNLLPPKPGLF